MLTASRSTPAGVHRLVVEHLNPIADDVVHLTLRSADGATLPPWSPGAHVDLHLGDRVRQYSMCGDPAEDDRYRVAVLRDPRSRGGSAFVHDRLRVGDRLSVSAPRNHFALQDSPRYLFIAGGIGITPLLPMIRAAEQAGARWNLVYGGRTRSSMGFLAELEHYGERVRIRPQDEHGLLDLDALLGTPEPDTLVYCCGPSPLLAAVTDHCARWPAGSLHTEHFAPVTGPVNGNGDEDGGDGPFEVEFRRSGVTVTVPAGTSVLDAADEAGIEIESSCSSGVCGTCESVVLEGDPVHHDAVLIDEDRAEGYFMPCVSRCRSTRLVLDR